MTENKRYSFNWVRGHPNFWDNHCDLADCYLTCEDVCELLNKLNDENNIFREALKELKEIGDYQVMRIRELDDENQKLEKENERLKRINKGQELEIVRLHKLADAMSGVLRELGVYDVYDKQQIENRKKENEQLKKEILWWKYRCGEDISGDVE